ncbi:MAG: hypothetical protein V1723_00015 [Candidatus Uhrbacteria bacterium]
MRQRCARAELVIDTVSTERAAVEVRCGGKIVVRREPLSVAGKPAPLLQMIHKAIKAAGIGLGEIALVRVNAGPGRFGRVRLGVVTANALAWAENISLISGNRRVRLAVPIYDSDPHIDPAPLFSSRKSGAGLIRTRIMWRRHH